MNKFKNPLDPENIQIKALLKQWIIAKFQLKKTVDIEIIEHNCSEASCVHAETTISIAHIENTEKEHYKISKPLTFIRKWDMEALKKVNSPHNSHRH
jgi:hypothetical protein